MRKTVRKTMLIVAILLDIALLTGCNTMQGMGKDLEKAGEKIQKPAK
ncbi:MAG: entericidin A/B family lipoprotein [Pseudomonadota bacterium]